MPTALLLSPHLDDAAFSAGGTAANLARMGYRVIIATAFTRSVPNPTGFALACQLDKGLDASIDYMALRRAEDIESCRILHVESRHLDFAEAPHRGYHSATELFRDPHADDDIIPQLAAVIASLIAELAPDLLFAPQCLGNHVDHIQLSHALLTLRSAESVVWWRDMPYAIRNPNAAPRAGLPTYEMSVDLTEVLTVKLDACAAFASQLGFQFGSETAMRTQLSRFAQSEAQMVSRQFAVERFRGTALELP